MDEINNIINEIQNEDFQKFLCILEDFLCSVPLIENLEEDVIISWLSDKMKEYLDNISEQEINEFASEIAEALREDKKNLEELEKKNKDGISAGRCLIDEVTKTMSALDSTEKSKYYINIERIDDISDYDYMRAEEYTIEYYREYNDKINNFTINKSCTIISADIERCIFSGLKDLNYYRNKSIKELKCPEKIVNLFYEGNTHLIKIAVAGALKTAAEKNILRHLKKGYQTGEIADMAFIGVENMNILYKMGKGKLGIIDGLSYISRISTATALRLLSNAGNIVKYGKILFSEKHMIYRASMSAFATISATNVIGGNIKRSIISATKTTVNAASKFREDAKTFIKNSSIHRNNVRRKRNI